VSHADWWRTEFLRAVQRHVPAVLLDLRDSVLPAHRAWQSRRKMGVDLEAAERVLHQELRSWRARHFMMTTDPEPERDWIAERARKTLDTWERSPRDDLLSRDELVQRTRSEIAEATARWQAAAGRDRRAAARRLILLKQQLAVEEMVPPVFLAPAFQWWSPKGVMPALLDLSDLRTDWSPENERLLAERFRAWRDAGRETPPTRTAKEYAHLRWLAWWQCAGFGYDAVSAREREWSSETCARIASALAVDLPRERRVRALAVLIDRGEPWIPFVSAPVWPKLWDGDDRELAKVAAWLAGAKWVAAAKHSYPSKDSIRKGVRAAAQLIRVQLREPARPGRRRSYTPPSVRRRNDR
jgi:hypothetical protein